MGDAAKTEENDLVEGGGSNLTKPQVLQAVREVRRRVKCKENNNEVARGRCWECRFQVTAEKGTSGPRNRQQPLARSMRDFLKMPGRKEWPSGLGNGPVA